MTAYLLHPVEVRTCGPVIRTGGVGRTFHHRERNHLVAREVVEEHVRVAVGLVHAGGEAVADLPLEGEARHDVPLRTGIDGDIVPDVRIDLSALSLRIRIHVRCDVVAVVVGVETFLAGILRHDVGRHRIDEAVDVAIRGHLSVTADEGIDEYQDVVGQVDGSIRTHGKAVETVLLQFIDTVLLQILGRECETADGVTAGNRNVVLGDGSSLGKEEIGPLCVRVTDGVILGACRLDFVVGVRRSASRVQINLVNILHIFPGVGHLRYIQRSLDARIAVIVHLDCTCDTAAGSYEDDAAAGLRTIDGSSRSILQDGHGLHGCGIKLVHVELEAVHEHEGVGAHERCHAANLDGGVVGTGSSGGLLHQNTGSSSLEGLGHLGDRFVGELRVVDDAHGGSDVLALLAGHTGDDCLFKHIHIVGKGDGKVSDGTCDVVLHILIAYAGEYEDVSFPGFDGEGSCNVGDDTGLCAFDVDRSPDYRLWRLLGVDYDTADCQFGP